MTYHVEVLITFGSICTALLTIMSTMVGVLVWLIKRQNDALDKLVAQKDTASVAMQERHDKQRELDRQACHELHVEVMGELQDGRRQMTSEHAAILGGLGRLGGST